MAFFRQEQIDKIIEIAKNAGEIALSFRKSNDYKISHKADNTEVTDADFAVSKFINENLTSAFPDIKLVCEENNLREFSEEIFWLIDPIDGTSSFIAGSDEFCVNIALIKNQKAIFGLLNAPAFEGGKLVTVDAQDKIILLHNKKTQILNPQKSITDKLRIVTSKKTSQINLMNFVNQFYPQFVENLEVVRMSSATKFISLLENKADIYLACRQTMEWDTAAGQALVELSGGNLKDLMLENSTYEITGDLLYKKNGFLNEFFVAYL